MNKSVVGIIIGIIVLVAIVVLALNRFGKEEPVVTPVQQPANIARPAVKPVPNTFLIMTPEEKAAAEAAKLAELESIDAATTSSSTVESEENEAN